MRHQMPLPEIVISDSEYHHLLVLAMAGTGRAAAPAEDLFYKLERTRIVSDDKVSPKIVRMRSRVAYRPDNGPEREVELVYPADADISVGRISILTPIGTALLGLRTGQSTTWTARDGRDHVLRVLRVKQPALVD